MAKFSRFLKRLHGERTTNNNEADVKETTEDETSQVFENESEEKNFSKSFKGKLGRIFGRSENSNDGGEIEYMDKDELETYAYSNYGIELDRRRTLKNMKKDFMNELKEQKGEQ